MRRPVLELAGLVLLGTLAASAQVAPGAGTPSGNPAQPAVNAGQPSVAPKNPATAPSNHHANAKTAPHSHKPARTARRAHRPQLEPDPVIPLPPPKSIPAFTPEQLPPQPPLVTYSDGRLTVDSQNSTLGDIVAAIRSQTGMRMELIGGTAVDSPPNARERVAAHLSGSARDVISTLLSEANVGYILVGAPDHPDTPKTVVFTTSPQNLPQTAVARPQAQVAPEPEEAAPEPPPPLPAVMQPPVNRGKQGQPGQPIQPGQPGAAGQPPNAYVGGEQPRFGQAPGQPPTQMSPQDSDLSQGQPDQQVKTPAQLLQELQQLRNSQNQNNPNTNNSGNSQQ